MKFEHTRVFNFEGAFRGLRNPLESWRRSDSAFGLANEYDDTDFLIANEYCDAEETTIPDIDEKIDCYASWLRYNGIINTDNSDDFKFEYAYLGPKDLDLAKRMIKEGTPNDKFLRQIFVSVDVTAPLYWWKEMDTYKIGTVANSTSTMHKLASTPITLNCFEIDDYVPQLGISEEVTDDGVFTYAVDSLASDLIKNLETLRQKYLETKDKKYWKELIRWLPESWLQTRTWTANYAVLRNIYYWRHNHKLSEWREFCNWIGSLPYANDLIIYNGKE